MGEIQAWGYLRTEEGELEEISTLNLTYRELVDLQRELLAKTANDRGKLVVHRSGLRVRDTALVPPEHWEPAYLNRGHANRRAGFSRYSSGCEKDDAASRDERTRFAAQQAVIEGAKDARWGVDPIHAEAGDGRRADVLCRFASGSETLPVAFKVQIGYRYPHEYVDIGAECRQAGIPLVWLVCHEAGKDPPPPPPDVWENAWVPVRVERKGAAAEGGDILLHAEPRGAHQSGPPALAAFVAGLLREARVRLEPGLLKGLAKLDARRCEDCGKEQTGLAGLHLMADAVYRLGFARNAVDPRGAADRRAVHGAGAALAATARSTPAAGLGWWPARGGNGGYRAYHHCVDPACGGRLATVADDAIPAGGKAQFGLEARFSPAELDRLLGPMGPRMGVHSAVFVPAPPMAGKDKVEVAERERAQAAARLAVSENAWNAARAAHTAAQQASARASARLAACLAAGREADGLSRRLEELDEAVGAIPAARDRMAELSAVAGAVPAAQLRLEALEATGQHLLARRRRKLRAAALAGDLRAVEAAALEEEESALALETLDAEKPAWWRVLAAWWPPARRARGAAAAAHARNAAALAEAKACLDRQRASLDTPEWRSREERGVASLIEAIARRRARLQADLRAAHTARRERVELAALIEEVERWRAERPRVQAEFDAAVAALSEAKSIEAGMEALIRAERVLRLAERKVLAELRAAHTAMALIETAPHGMFQAGCELGPTLK